MAIRCLAANASPEVIQREFKLTNVPVDQLLPHLLERLKDEPFLPSLLNLCLDRMLPPTMARPDLHNVPRAAVIRVFWDLVLASRAG